VRERRKTEGGESEKMGERKQEDGKESETGRMSKLQGPQETCVVSYRACRGQGTWKREVRAKQEGRQAKATVTWLVGRGGGQH
jgi:hypothetical protein